jgi:hypothetical protein
MRLEAAQAGLLISQSLAYVWRKQAFRTLVQHATQLTPGAGLAEPPPPPPVRDALGAFREPVDYHVPNTPHVRRSAASQLAAAAEQHARWLTTDDQRAMVASLLDAARCGDVGARPGGQEHGEDAHLDLTREQVGLHTPNFSLLNQLLAVITHPRRPTLRSGCSSELSKAFGVVPYVPSVRVERLWGASSEAYPSTA